MNCTTKNELKTFDVLFTTSMDSLIQIKAHNSDEACRIASACLGLDDGSWNHTALSYLQACRHDIGAVSPESCTDHMECSINHELNVLNEGDENAYLHRSVSFTLCDGDEFDPEAAFADDDYFMVYLLENRCELVPFDQFDSFLETTGDELGCENIPGSNLRICYDSASVLVVDGERYLIGPALIFGDDDCAPAPMTYEEVLMAEDILDERTIILTADQHTFYALKLFEEDCYGEE